MEALAQAAWEIRQLRHFLQEHGFVEDRWIRMTALHLLDILTAVYDRLVLLLEFDGPGSRRSINEE